MINLSTITLQPLSNDDDMSITIVTRRTLVRQFTQEATTSVPQGSYLRLPAVFNYRNETHKTELPYRTFPIQSDLKCVQMLALVMLKISD